MLYYVALLGLLTLENVREVILTVEHNNGNSTSLINNFNRLKGKRSSDQELFSDQIQRTSPNEKETDKKNEDKRHFYKSRNQKTDVKSIKQDNMTSGERIIGGSVIDISEAPSYVMIESLTTKGNLFCAGNILNNYHILTAAHCVSIKNEDNQGPRYTVLNPDQVTIVPGAMNFYDDYHLMKAKQIWIHPEYLEEPEVELYRDVAIVRTSREMVYSDTIQKVYIHPSIDNDNLNGKKCTVAGWGKTENDPYSDELRRVDVTLIAQKECKSLMKSKMSEDVHICSLDYGKDACQGDSGAGLICNDMLLALASWGEGCGTGKYPGVYARVDNALDFITPIVKGVASSKAAYFSASLTTLLHFIFIHFHHY